MGQPASSTSRRAKPDFRLHGVSPFGEFDAEPSPERMMGNRGPLTDADGNRVKRWEHQHWITCKPFGPAPGDLKPPQTYTRLSFLDEATASAAGHRPCGRCRNKDMKAFQEHWLIGHPQDTTMTAVDVQLHKERTNPEKQTALCAELPYGAMVSFDGRAWLVVEDRLYAWNDDGYSDPRAFPPGPVDVLTPPSTVAAMDAGWRPTVHHSAG